MLFFAVIAFYITNNAVLYGITENSYMLMEVCKLKTCETSGQPIQILLSYSTTHSAQGFLGFVTMLESLRLGFDFERLYWCVGLARILTMNSILVT